MASAWQKHLAQFGYTPILLPSSDFDVFTLVYERDGKRGHDHAFDTLTANASGARPEVVRGDYAGNITGGMTRKFGVSAGLNILGGLLSALGAGKLGLSVAFEGASEIEFSYESVTKDHVSAVALEMFLRTAPAPTSGLLKRWLDDHLYAMTAVLRAKKLSVSAKDSSDQKLELDVPVIKDIVGGNIKVERGASSSTTVTFEGENALPFAAILYRIKRFTPDDPDTMTLRAARPGSARIKSMNSAANSEAEFEEMDETDLIMPDVLEGGIGGFET